jgi:hypothetical protein
MSCDSDFIPAVFALSFHLASAVSLVAAVATRQWLFCGAVLLISAVAFVVTQFVQFVPRVAAAEHSQDKAAAAAASEDPAFAQLIEMSATQGETKDQPKANQGNPQLTAQQAFDQAAQESMRTISDRNNDLDAQLQFENERMTRLSTQYWREQELSYWNN